MVPETKEIRLDDLGPRSPRVGNFMEATRLVESDHFDIEA